MSKDKGQSIDIEGATVEEAIQRAMEELSAARDEIDVEIMCEEKKGLFGMEGEKPAKIRVFLK
ncbi:MAG: spoIIIJ-associated protein [Lysobacterales bacterium]|jgi:spoIIIJ-associated protein